MATTWGRPHHAPPRLSGECLTWPRTAHHNVAAERQNVGGRCWGRCREDTLAWKTGYSPNSASALQAGRSSGSIPSSSALEGILAWPRLLGLARHVLVGGGTFSLFLGGLKRSHATGLSPRVAGAVVRSSRVGERGCRGHRTRRASARARTGSRTAIPARACVRSSSRRRCRPASGRTVWPPRPRSV